MSAFNFFFFQILYPVCGYETAAAAAAVAAVITQHACTTRISVVRTTYYTIIHVNRYNFP